MRQIFRIYCWNFDKFYEGNVCKFFHLYPFHLLFMFSFPESNYEWLVNQLACTQRILITLQGVTLPLQLTQHVIYLYNYISALNKLKALFRGIQFGILATKSKDFLGSILRPIRKAFSYHALDRKCI